MQHVQKYETKILNNTPSTLQYRTHTGAAHYKELITHNARQCTSHRAQGVHVSSLYMRPSDGKVARRLAVVYTPRPTPWFQPDDTPLRQGQRPVSSNGVLGMPLRGLRLGVHYGGIAAKAVQNCRVDGYHCLRLLLLQKPLLLGNNVKGHRRPCRAIVSTQVRETTARLQPLQQQKLPWRAVWQVVWLPLHSTTLVILCSTVQTNHTQNQRPHAHVHSEVFILLCVWSHFKVLKSECINTAGGYTTAPLYCCDGVPANEWS
jgi:hypothetical protein